VLALEMFERFAQLDGALVDQLLQFVVGAMRIDAGLRAA
jgi:hypothetical protein